MKLLSRLTQDLSSRRAQHLVYLVHVWLCVPFLLFWITDKGSRHILGAVAVDRLQILVIVIVCYMILRTWLAYIDPPKLNWGFLFPPIDVALITVMLCITHRGPMSHIAYLYFLPMVQASGLLNARWSMSVGIMVIIGTVVATFFNDVSLANVPVTAMDLLRQDPISVAFRICFLLIISSLMAYQTLIAAGLRERLGVAADRNRIAMEMHDGVQGHLITIASQLELISRVAESDGKRAAEIAQSGREGARQAADELRFLVQRLRTPTMEGGFVAALRQYSHNICERNRLRLVFEVTGKEIPLTPEVENALFRIAQEALTNIVKHAEARNVTVAVDFSLGNAKLSVVDDGDGFNLATSASGIGLEGMRQRAADNHGSLLLESATNAGTRVEADFMIEVSNA